MGEGVITLPVYGFIMRISRVALAEQLPPGINDYTEFREIMQ